MLRAEVKAVRVDNSFRSRIIIFWMIILVNRRKETCVRRLVFNKLAKDLDTCGLFQLKEKYKKRRSEILEEVKRVEENTMLEEAQGPFLHIRESGRKTGRRMREAETGDEGVHL